MWLQVKVNLLLKEFRHMDINDEMGVGFVA